VSDVIEALFWIAGLYIIWVCIGKIADYVNAWLEGLNDENTAGDDSDM